VAEQSDLLDLEKRLTDIARRRSERIHLRAQLDTARHEADSARRQLAARRSDMRLAADDVRTLESLSITRILAGLRGTRDADLDRESAEHEAARYHVTLAERRVDLAESAVTELAHKIDDLGDVDALWAAVLDDKEAAILRSRLPRARRLGEIATRRGELDALDRECREAVAAGRAALDGLVDALQILGSADSWSAYDTWFGGGMISSTVKHQKLDEAVRRLHVASEALRAYEREVADLGRDAAAHVELEKWDRIFDVWFDNVFTDLAVRRRIKDAIHDVEHAIAVVEAVAAQIATDSRQYAAEQTRLAVERDELLTQN
jgi:hypothetical protein